MTELDEIVVTTLQAVPDRQIKKLIEPLVKVEISMTRRGFFDYGVKLLREEAGKLEGNAVLGFNCLVLHTSPTSARITFFGAVVLLD